MVLFNLLPRWARAGTALLAFLLPRAGGCTDLGLDGFRIGITEDEVVSRLGQRFGEVERVRKERYQVPRDFYAASEPRDAYRLGDLPVIQAEAYIGSSGTLVQMKFVLDAERLDALRNLLPDFDAAAAEEPFRGNWVISREEGEFVLAASRLFGTVSVEYSGRAQAGENARARRISDERFKRIDTRLDRVIELLDSSQGH